MKNTSILIAASDLILIVCGDANVTRKLVASGDDGSGHAKPTQQTVRANAAVLETLPFDDETDFELARRGFIAARKDSVIRDAAGKVVWNLADYQSVTGDSPDSVNPSLWRQAKLNSIYGLFKVAERRISADGSTLSLIEFFAMLDEQDPAFEIALP